MHIAVTSQGLLAANGVSILDPVVGPINGQMAVSVNSGAFGGRPYDKIPATCGLYSGP